MNTMTKAMLEMAGLDELAGMDTPVHRLHPLVKLILAVAYIAAVISFPGNTFTGLTAMVLLPVLTFQISRIPVRTCFYRLRFILPLVCAVGIWNPVLDRRPALVLGGLTVSAGMLSFLTLMLKGVFALMASFLLIATTGIEKICYALRLLHVPEILVTQMLITYRYISLMLREAGTMMNAYSLRAPGQKGIHHSAWGSFVGQLLLRSMDRAETLFAGMQLRGFHGSFYYAGVMPWRRTDTAVLVIGIAAILFLRLFNLAAFLGGIFA